MIYCPTAMKKRCVGCGKQIPSVALDCVFCSARQPTEGDVVVAGEGGGQPLLGAGTAEINAVVAQVDTPAAEPANEAHAGANGAAAVEVPPQTKLTGVMQAVQIPVAAEVAPPPQADPPVAQPVAPAPEVAQPVAPAPEADPVDAIPVAVVTEAAPVRVGRRRTAPEPRPFAGLARVVMGVGGAVLIAVFCVPWHGVSSWQLLETLSGADFVRQLFYLTGGVVLLASALLPLPFLFRAMVGAAVAAMPVLLGAGGVLEGWRGVVAALAILGLPATHLLRANVKSSAWARGLVAAAVAAVVVLYVVPAASVVPIVAVVRMVGSGEVAATVMGIFVLIPLIFAGLSLLGLLGRDLTDVGVLLSVLSLLWAPVVVALRGLIIEDTTQLYVAMALLWASATAALSLAQLLSLAAHERTRAA